MNKEPKKGMVGIDLRTVPLVKGARDFWVAGEFAKKRDVVALLTV